MYLDIMSLLLNKFKVKLKKIINLIYTLKNIQKSNYSTENIC